MSIARHVALTIALVWASLSLAESPDLQGGKAENQAATAKTLALVDSVVIKSEVAQFFIHPIKCDGDGNVYLMTQIDATTGIRKLNPKVSALPLLPPAPPPISPFGTRRTLL